MTHPHGSPGPEDRRIDIEVVVAGTPEQVWEVIATGPGVTAWMQPTEIEPRPGGRYAFDLQDGAGPNDTGHVSEYDPPHRFATSAVEWRLVGDAAPAALATEWIVQARDSGTCVVRLVMSGFGPGAAWDNEVGEMRTQLRRSLDQLRRYLDNASTKGSPCR